MCSIPNRPETYNPLEHYDNTIKRKDRILKQLLQEKKITEAEYSDVYTEIVLIRRGDQESGLYGYLCDQLCDKSVDAATRI